MKKANFTFRASGGITQTDETGNLPCRKLFGGEKLAYRGRTVRKMLFAFLSMAVLMAFSTTSALAAVTEWNGGTDDDWTNAANWTAGVPVNGDDIVYNTTVNNADPATIPLGALSLLSIHVQNGTLTIPDGVTFDVDDAGAASNINDGVRVEATGILNVFGGTLTVGTNGLIDNDGIEVNGGTINVGGSNNALVPGQTGTILIGASVGADGIELNGGSFNNGGFFGSAVVSVDGNAAMGVQVNAGAVFNNGGVPTAGGTASMTVSNTANDGITVNGGTFNNAFTGTVLTINMTGRDGIRVNNNGVFSQLAGVAPATPITNIDNTTNAGIITPATGGTVTVSAGTVNIGTNGGANNIGTNGIQNANGNTTTITGATVNIQDVTIDGIQNAGAFKNDGNAAISIRTAGGRGVDNTAVATFDNVSGSFLTIIGTGNDGIRNNGIFNNADGAGAGTINITDVATGEGIDNNNEFNNVDGGAISILRTTIGDGINNTSVFNNTNGGTIAIDDTGRDGIRNTAAGTFFSTDAGTMITIGAAAGTDGHGINNIGMFSNDMTAVINIDATTLDGINNTGTFNNNVPGLGSILSVINIGLNTATGGDGINNSNVFFNTTGGQINIAQAGDDGIFNSSDFRNVDSQINVASAGSDGIENTASGFPLGFDNTTLGGNATINIGEAASAIFAGPYLIGEDGIKNSGDFNNTGGGLGAGTAAINIDGGAGCSIIESGIHNELGAIFQNAPSGAGASNITIDGSSLSGIENDAVFNNRGNGLGGTATTTIGSTNAPKENAILNNATGTFNNNTHAAIDIDGARQDGIHNLGIFANDDGGDPDPENTIITIDGVLGDGIENTGGVALFTNTNTQAVIRISGAAKVGQAGINNNAGAAFMNFDQGYIDIDGTTAGHGISNDNATFTNGNVGGAPGAAFIDIDNVMQGNDGINNANGATFMNTRDAGGLLTSIINIGQAGAGSIPGDGIENDATSVFMNTRVSIINISNAGEDGIENAGDFDSNLGADINISNVAGDGIENSGTFDNDGVNPADATDKSTITINNATEDGIANAGGTFTNSATADINIDMVVNGIVNGDAGAGGTFLNTGASTIDIGATTGPTTAGIHNICAATFTNNTDSDITIDNTGGNGVTNTGTFTNTGAGSDMTIGTTAIGGMGIANIIAGACATPSFNNLGGAFIDIMNTTGNGVRNDFSFLNSGAGTELEISDVGGNGIINTATAVAPGFFNADNAVIDIDNPAADGIQNDGNFITGEGTFVDIDGVPAGNNAIENSVTGFFLATGDGTGGDAVVDASNDANGTDECDGGTILNAGQILIDECAQLIADGLVDNTTGGGTIQVVGYWTQQCGPGSNPPGPLANTTAADFDNDGVVIDPKSHFAHGTLLNNDDLVVDIPSPKTVTICDTEITDVLLNKVDVGAPGDGNDAVAETTWYRDFAQTIPAGTYDNTTNIFTPVFQPLLAGLNVFHFDVDVDGFGAGCDSRPASVQIFVNPNCYDLTNGVGIGDPCSCNNDATVNGDDGTFNERVAVTGANGTALAAGQTWTVVSVIGDINNVIPAGSTGTQNGAGHYTFPAEPGHFQHRDMEGYTLIVQGPNPDTDGDPTTIEANNVTLSIGNTCFYPDPELVGIGPVCSADAPVALSASVTTTLANAFFDDDGDMVADPPAYIFTAGGTTFFDPAVFAAAGLGNTATIFYVVQDAPNTNGIHNPGCWQAVSMQVEVFPAFNPSITGLADNSCDNAGNVQNLSFTGLAALTAYIATTPNADTQGDYVNWYIGNGAAGLAEHATNGTATFDPDAAGPGDYTICVDVGTGSCIQTHCEDITVHAIPSAAWANPTFVADCADLTLGSNQAQMFTMIDLTSLLAPTATAGGTFAAVGLNFVGGSTFMNDVLRATPGCYQISYTVEAYPGAAADGSGCTATQNLDLLVRERPQPSFDLAEQVCWDGVAGSVSLPTLYNGETFGGSPNVAGTVAGPTRTYQWTAQELPAGPPFPTLPTFSDATAQAPVITIQAAGTFQICLQETLTYPACNAITAIAAGGCAETICHTLTVTETNVSVIASWTPPADQCNDDAIINLETLLNVGATTGGVFTGVGVSPDPVTGHPAYDFDPSAAGNAGATIAVTYTIDNGSGCTAVETHNIVVHPDVNATLTPTTEICIDGAQQFDLTSLFSAATTQGGTFSQVNTTGTSNVVGDILTYDANQQTPVTVVVRYNVGVDLNNDGDFSNEGDCGQTATATITITDGFDLALIMPDVCFDTQNASQLDFENYLAVTDNDGTPLDPEVLPAGATGAWAIVAYDDGTGAPLFDEPGDATDGNPLADGAGNAVSGTINAATGVYTKGTGNGFVTVRYTLTHDNTNGFDCISVVESVFELRQALTVAAGNCACVAGARQVALTGIGGGLAPYQLTADGATITGFTNDGTDTDATLTLLDGVENWSVTLIDARGCEVNISGSCGPFTEAPVLTNVQNAVCATDPDFVITAQNLSGAGTVANNAAGTYGITAGANVIANGAASIFTDNLDGTLSVSPDFVIANPGAAGTYTITYTYGNAADLADDCQTHTVVEQLTIYPSFDACFSFPAPVLADATVCKTAAPFTLAADDDLANSSLFGETMASLSRWVVITGNGTIYDTEAGVPTGPFTAFDAATGDVTFDPDLLPAGTYTVQHITGFDACQTECAGTITIKPTVDATLADRTICGSPSGNIDLNIMYSTGTTPGGNFTIISASSAGPDGITGTADDGNVMNGATPALGNVMMGGDGILTYDENGFLNYTVVIEYEVGREDCEVTALDTDAGDCYMTDQATLVITGGHSAFLDLPEAANCSADPVTGAATTIPLFPYMSIEDVTWEGLPLDVTANNLLVFGAPNTLQNGLPPVPAAGTIRFDVVAVDGSTSLDAFIVDGDVDNGSAPFADPAAVAADIASGMDFDYRSVIDNSACAGNLLSATCPVINLDNVPKEVVLTIRVTYNDGGCVAIAEDNILVRPTGDATIMNGTPICANTTLLNLPNAVFVPGTTTICGKFKVNCLGMPTTDPGYTDANGNGYFDPADPNYPNYDVAALVAALGFDPPKLYITYMVGDTNCKVDMQDATIDVCGTVTGFGNVVAPVIACTEGTPLNLETLGFNANTTDGGTWYGPFAPGTFTAGPIGPPPALPAGLAGNEVADATNVNPIPLAGLGPQQFVYYVAPDCVGCPAMLSTLVIEVTAATAETCQFFGDGVDRMDGAGPVADLATEYCIDAVPANPLLLRRVCPEVVPVGTLTAADCDVAIGGSGLPEANLSVSIPAGSYFPNAKINDDWFIQLIYINQTDADCVDGSTVGVVDDPDDMDGGDHAGFTFTGTGAVGNLITVANNECVNTGGGTAFYMADFGGGSYNPLTPSLLTPPAAQRCAPGGIGLGTNDYFILQLTAADIYAMYGGKEAFLTAFFGNNCNAASTFTWDFAAMTLPQFTDVMMVFSGMTIYNYKEDVCAYIPDPATNPASPADLGFTIDAVCDGAAQTGAAANLPAWLTQARLDAAINVNLAVPVAVPGTCLDVTLDLNQLIPPTCDDMCYTFEICHTIEKCPTADCGLADGTITYCRKVTIDRQLNLQSNTQPDDYMKLGCIDASKITVPLADVTAAFQVSSDICSPTCAPCPASCAAGCFANGNWSVPAPFDDYVIYDGTNFIVLQTIVEALKPNGVPSAALAAYIAAVNADMDPDNDYPTDNMSKRFYIPVNFTDSTPCEICPDETLTRHMYVVTEPDVALDIPNSPGVCPEEITTILLGADCEWPDCVYELTLTNADTYVLIDGDANNDGNPDLMPGNMNPQVPLAGVVISAPDPAAGTIPSITIDWNVVAQSIPEALDGDFSLALTVYCGVDGQFCSDTDTMSLYFLGEAAAQLEARTIECANPYNLTGMFTLGGVVSGSGTIGGGNFTYQSLGADGAVGGGDDGLVVDVAGNEVFLGEGVYRITYTAGIEGCTESGSAILTIDDTIDPTFDSAPTNIVSNNDPDKCGANVNWTIPTGDDTCSETVTVTQTAGPAPGSFFPVGGPVTITYVANDGNGNTATHSFTVTVNDMQLPEINCPESLTVGTDAGVCNAVVNGIDPQFTYDNCASSFAYVITGAGSGSGSGSASGSTFPIGTSTVTYTIVDASGNTRDCAFNVTVVDDEAPMITCAVDVDGDNTFERGTNNTNCSFTMGSNGFDPTSSSDNCPGGLTVTHDYFVQGDPLYTGTNDNTTLLGAIFPTGTTTVTWTATDAAGNSASCEIVVVVSDDDAPVFTNCPDGATLTVDITAASTIGMGSITATGGTNDVNLNVAAINPCGVTMSYDDLVATDNCPVPDLAFLGSVGAGPNFYEYGSSYTESYVVTDGAGNTASCSFTIVVNDAVNPTITCPANITVANDLDACGAVVDYSNALGFDNCTGQMEITLTSGQPSGSFFAVGATHTITYEVEDAANNTQTCSFTIDVNDEERPLVVCPTDVVTSNDAGNCSAVVNSIDVTATDNCGTTNVSYVITGAGSGSGSGSASGSTFPVGSSQVTYTVNDGNGNTSICNFEVTVEDTEDPTISCPAAATLTCNDELPAPTDLAGLMAADNCGTADLTLVVSDVDNGNTVCPSDGARTVTRTYTVFDGAGNTVTCTQVFTYDEDNTAPAFSSMPNDINVSCGEQITAAPILTATDACPFPVDIDFSEVILPGACDNDFQLVRTWVATDGCGNASTVTQTVTVSDTDAPVLAGTPAATVNVSCAEDVPAVAAVTATDNCNGPVDFDFSEVEIPGTCPNSYSITRTWSASDACGNAVSFTQTITISDTDAPVLAGTPATTIVNLECADAVPAVPTVTATDNCGAPVDVEFSEVEAPGVCLNSYSITRTWTAEDDCGNIASFTQTINISDTDAPVLAGTPTATVDVSCSENVPAVATVTATDNCGGSIDVDFVEVEVPGTCINSYSIVRTWSAEDACGNAASFTQTINISDTDAPVLAGTPAATVDVSCAENVPAVAAVTATDNCGASFDLDFTEVEVPGTCPNSYSIVRTWSAEDACGNAASFTQTITISDTENPVLVGTPATPLVLVSCTENIPAAPSNVTATDNCGAPVDVEFTETTDDETCANQITIIRTWTAVDVCGNTATFGQLIIVNDTEAPVLVGTPAAATVSVSCSEDVPNVPPVTATDNCSAPIDVEFSEVEQPGGCLNSYLIVRTWTAEDDCGNLSIFTQTITVSDTEAPVLAGTPAATVNVSCAEDVPAVAAVTATDNCGASFDLDFTEVEVPGTCPNSYSITRTWSAEDACGNATSFTQTITISDTEAPVLAGTPAATVNVSCAEDVPAVAVVTATDNCGASFDLDFTEVEVPGTCPNSYSITRTWSAEDACGNATSFTQTITISDTEAPVLVGVPTTPLVNVSCTDNIPTAPTNVTATDNCGATVDVEFTETTSNESCPNQITILRTWTAVDVCGNTASFGQIIIVNDTEAPTLIGLPATATVDVNCAEDVPNVPPVFASDNCNVPVDVEFSEVEIPGTCPNSYSITRTWSAQDDCGNATSFTQTINVSDTEAPTWDVVLPTDVTAQCADEVLDAPVATASDNCGVVVDVEFNETTTPGDCPNSFTIVRTWSAEDDCGNMITHVQTITVDDDTNPTMTCPAPLSVQCDASEEPPYANLNEFLLAGGSADDNCGLDAGSFGLVSEVLGVGGVVTRTYEISDACGNTVTCTQTITILDTEDPVFVNCPTTTLTVSADPGECTALVNWSIPVASDNCTDPPTVTQTQGPAPGTAVAVGATVAVTYTATDAAGNTAVCSFDVEVIDTEEPDAACQDITISLDGTGAATIVSTDVDGGSADACGIVSLAIDITDFDCSNVGDNNVTLTVTDVSGNTSSCVSTVTVVDDEAPTFTCPSVAALASCDGTVPDLVSLVTDAADNCGVASIEQDPAANIDFVGSVDVTVTVTDVNGNATSCVVTVTVDDTTAPEFLNCPTTMVMVGNDPDECSAKVNWSIPVAVDDCPDVTVTQTAGPAPGTEIPVGTTFTVTYTATDVAGNSTSCSFDVLVVDTQDPFITECAADRDVFTNPGVCNGTVPDMTGEVIFDENCTAVVTQDPVAGSTFGTAHGDQITVTMTVTDEAGNTDECEVVLTLIDNEDPDAVCQDITIDLPVTGMASITAADIDGGSTDNCQIVSIEITDGQVDFDCDDAGQTFQVELTVTDIAGNTDVCVADVTIVAHPHCDPSISGNDPCVCSDQFPGFFDETVTILALTNQTWTVTALSGLSSIPGTSINAGVTLTETPAGSGIYTLSGIHESAIGYSITAENGLGDVLSFASTCYLPEIEIQGLQDLSNQCDDPFTIVGIEINGVTPEAGSSLFIDGPGNADFLDDDITNGFEIIIEPNGLPAGPYVVTFTFNAGIATPNDPNDPGCIVVETGTFTIVDPVQTMTCNNTINVSLDDDCCVTITPDMILEGPAGPDGVFDVQLTDAIGTPLFPVDQVCTENIGQELIVTITEECSGQSCWGHVNVEDKLAPALTCPDDITIFCNNETDPVFTGEIIVFDCSDIDLLDYTDEEVNFDNCEDVQRIITRTFVAMDEHGNQSECTQTITVAKPTLDDIHFPEDIQWTCENLAAFPNITEPTARHPFVGDSNPATPIIEVVLDETCDDDDADLPFLPPNHTQDNPDINATNPVNGGLGCPGFEPFTGTNGLDDADVLELTGSGIPLLLGQDFQGIGSCMLSIDWEDEIFNICSGSFEILRTWKVRDMCLPVSADNPRTHTQVIKVLDLKAPTLDAPADITVSANISASHPDECRATFFLPAIGVTDVCSDGWDIEIDHPLGHIDGNGGFVEGLDRGVHQATYTVTDDCGNVVTTTINIHVVDDIPPTTQCDELTTVSLSSDGLIIVNAGVFDDGTHDNCCLDNFVVKRMGQSDNAFGPTETFTCNDINNSPITVVFRAYDCDGNYNECMVDVIVEDKTIPVLLSCPGNQRVTCDFYWDNLATALELEDYSVLNQFGGPTFIDNCDPIVTPTVNENVNECGEGTITRTWSATDPSGNGPVNCTQTIFVDHVSDWVIEFPGDITVTCTDEVPDFGEPEIFFESCELIATSYEDQLYTNVTDACYKIARQWTVINWCVVGDFVDQEVTEVPENQLGLPFPLCDLDGDGDCDNKTFRDSWNGTDFPGTADATTLTGPDTDFDTDPWDGFITYEQIIKVIDDVAPVLTCTDTYEVCIEGNGCTTSISVPAPEVDDCSQDITITATSDLPGFNGTNFTAINVGPGTYTVTFTVEDNCGNTSACQTTVVVTDCKLPTPYCKNGLVIELMPTGMVEIWALDFNAGSFDNCTAQDDLELSFSANTNDIGATFDCDHVGQQVVQLWVTDEAGNQDYCETFVIIQDNTGACPNPGDPQISGVITTEDDDEVALVDVELNGGDQMMQTTGSGAYNFNVASGSDITVTPLKDIEPLNGVTTFDLVLITKHILGVQELDSPYKLIAADANSSKTVTTFDLVQLRRLILHIDDEFASNTSWRFVEKAYEFPDATNPWVEDFPEFINHNNVDAAINNADFIAVKIGDVNNSSDPLGFSAADDREKTDDLVFVIEEARLTAGQEHVVEFRAKDFNALGYQFTLNFNQDALEFVDILPGVAGHENFGLRLLDDGAITASWNNEHTKVADDEVVFSMIFLAMEDAPLSSLLTINSRYTASEAYSHTGELHDVVLEFTGDVAAAEFALLQNTPNPVDAKTTVGFVLPEATTATLTISDATGRIVRIIEGDYAKGYNQVVISRNDLGAAGVLYYQLETSTDSATKSMIVVD